MAHGSWLARAAGASGAGRPQLLFLFLLSGSCKSADQLRACCVLLLSFARGKGQGVAKEAVPFRGGEGGMEQQEKFPSGAWG
jgi:hypothetical protein